MKKIVCPRCKTQNFGENNFCKECLTDLVVFAPQGYHARWSVWVRI